jgi:hypothetical protein
MLLDPFNAVANTTVSWWNSGGDISKRKEKIKNVGMSTAVTKCVCNVGECVKQ